MTRTLLARGSYGKCYINNERTIVKKQIKIKYYGVLNELLFLNTFCTEKIEEFLPLLHKFEVHKKKIVLAMSYEGHNLEYFAKKVQLSDKLTLMPSFIIQIFSMLKWLKKNKIIHMDIKPENICISYPTDLTNPKLKLIDFGFTIPYTDSSMLYYGTPSFAEPTYFSTRKHSYRYDMYCAGITLFYILNRRYIHYENILDGKYKSLLNELNYYKILKEIALLNKNNENENENENEKIDQSLYVKFLRRMITYDEKSRISADTFIDIDLMKSNLEVMNIKLIDINPIKKERYEDKPAQLKYPNIYSKELVEKNVIKNSKYGMMEETKHLYNFLKEKKLEIKWNLISGDTH
jgi:serine/threonine protein kinase